MVLLPDKKLTDRTFDQLLEEVAEASQQFHHSVTLDFTEIGFVDPYGMIGLILLLRFLKMSSGASPKIILPQGDVRSYLGRAAFLQEAARFADFLPPLDQVWLRNMKLLEGSTPSLLEVSLLRDSCAIPGVLNHVENALRDQLAYKKANALDICIMLSEISHNVFDHNEAGTICYVAMQTYTDRQENKFLCVSVGDNGVGIPDTLRTNTRYAHLENDSDAIRESLKKHVSRLDEHTRGNGLYHLLELVWKHAGRMCIRSYAGGVYVRADRKEERIYRSALLPGTQFGVSFPS